MHQREDDTTINPSSNESIDDNVAGVDPSRRRFMKGSLGAGVLAAVDGFPLEGFAATTDAATTVLGRTLYPDQGNPARWVREIVAGAETYQESFNPMHFTRGVWSARFFADRPMGSTPPNYGAASPYKRPYDGKRHVAIHEYRYQGAGNNVVELQNESLRYRTTVPDSTGGGSTDILVRVRDPSGLDRMVWKFQANYLLLWSDGASGPLGGEGRRRNELRSTAHPAFMLPYNTDLWTADGIYLDPTIDWAAMSPGDYVMVNQMHDTSQGGGFNNPSFASYICARDTTRAGDWPDPPNRWNLLYQVRNRHTLPEHVRMRWWLTEPPTGRWIYIIRRLRYNGPAPFLRVWTVIAGEPPSLSISLDEPWGVPDDVATDFTTCGIYSPGLYQGTVPVRRIWQTGTVQIPAAVVPGMTPERMVACLEDQQA